MSPQPNCSFPYHCRSCHCHGSDWPVDIGNYVNPGQALFAIVQDNMWVTANFKETQLASMHPGQPVDIDIDAIPSVTFHGRVDSLQPGTGSVFSVP